jgi:hypothetical protein
MVIVSYQRNGQHWLTLAKHPETAKSWKVFDRNKTKIALVPDEALQAFCETVLIAMPELSLAPKTQQ